ncbi:uncharacterized protein LOC133720801 [Rosa rugosa]|uniref:uncharacterized protein LOC133720801 n=1 Tax=Rosa rugosa TaxID=74645 RepID=UPI002B407C7C|nr:uncharacterized protein LOC133720801 [Rosa rugosa]
MECDLPQEEVQALLSLYDRLSSYLIEKEAYERVATLEYIDEEFSDHEEEEEPIRLAPAALDDTPPKVRDPTEKVNLGTEAEPIEVAISENLEPDEKQRLINLLQEFKDCFAEKYEDMPGLAPELVCHKLPTIPDHNLVRQESRRMNSETQVLVKEEVEKMHKSGIIRVAKYNQWLSNVVPVRKKNGKIRVCIDYRDLNNATPKDVYPMPVADMLVDAVAGHEQLSFMDGTANYHQIPVAEEDRHKTAFRCLGFAGVFEYVVMPFGLKNAGATYQRAMNLIFHEILGKILEVYIDDVVVKSKQRGNHISDLRKQSAYSEFRGGDFLGFIVHQRGIEVSEDKAKAVINASPPRTKKELQRLLGKINFLRRFISNSAGKIHPFSALLKLQGQTEFVWEAKHQEAFDRIKAYLANPPVLVPPKPDQPLKLYVSAAETSIGSLLAQNDEEGIEHAIFYLSRTLTDCETRYTPMEKLCLTLYFSACKLRHYMLSFTTCIIAQTDLVKYMLSRPILRGRIGKWVLALSEFSLQYVPQKAVKGQAIADFLAHHPILEVTEICELEVAAITSERPYPEPASGHQATIMLQPWVLYFDGSRTETMAGAGIALENPAGEHFSYSFQMEYQCTNNQAEYEALIIGMEILLEMGVRDVQILGDSLLVINQVCGKYRCGSFALIHYLNRVLELADQFDDVGFEHIPREYNVTANELAQLATGITLRFGVRERILKVQRRTLPSWMAREDPPYDISIATLESIDLDWRIPLIAYLKDPDQTTDRRIRFLALNYFLRNDELRRRGEDGLDFRCVYGSEAKRLIRETHSGICGAHQAGPKMRWLLRRHGYFWPSILKDCIAFTKGCPDCQAHGPVQHVPNIPMQPIIKPWPARGWALDLIGMIHPHLSLQHKFIIVATDYFTKWVEAEPLKEASGGTLRQFLFRNIICRFGIPEVFVSDRGVAFVGGEVAKLAEEWGIQFIHSSPYYAQSNGQAEASNKIVITLLKKMLEANPRQWHETLYETLWAYRTSKRSPTAATPYALMFGHDAILPLEVNVQSLRVQEQHHLIGEDYVQAMWQEHEDLSTKHLEALDSLIMEKQRVALAYDKRTRGRSFSEGELVWKAILPLGEKLHGRGKWTPRWEGPYVIYKILQKGAFHLKDLDGDIHHNPINDRYLKKYFPSVWDSEKS